MDEFSIDHSMSQFSRGENSTGRWWALARKCVIGLSLAVACQTALAQAMYRIKPIGTPGGCPGDVEYVMGLNEHDEVTGRACNSNGDYHAFLWRNDGNPMVDLGPDEVGSASGGNAINASGLVAGFAQDSSGEFAFESSGDGSPMTRVYNSLGGSTILPRAINDLGQLTGYASMIGDTTNHAFLWKNDGSALLDLGTLGGDQSDAFGINASGQVAGFAYLLDNIRQRAVVWINNGTRKLNLGTLGGRRLSQALLINASGQVAGNSYLHVINHLIPEHAFLWKNDGTPMQDLGTLGGLFSAPTALNDSGQVAGQSSTSAGAYHAFVWLNDGTPMKDLGTLGGTKSYVYGINSSGQVTGFSDLANKNVVHAFLWRNDGTNMQDLNALIDPTDPLKPYVTLTQGDYINDLGDILAYGTDSRTGQVDVPYLLQGTVLTLSPRSLAFGSLPIGTSSAAKSVTMTNTSPKVVAITSIALKGTGAGQFVLTNNCGSSLVGHANCTIKVAFKPTTTGAKSATLNVNGGGGGLRVVNLTGTGT